MPDKNVNSEKMVLLNFTISNLKAVFPLPELITGFSNLQDFLERMTRLRTYQRLGGCFCVFFYGKRNIHVLGSSRFKKETKGSHAPPLEGGNSNLLGAKIAFIKLLILSLFNPTVKGT